MKTLNIEQTKEVRGGGAGVLVAGVVAFIVLVGALIGSSKS